MRKILSVLLILLIFSGTAFADTVFNHLSTAENVSKYIPELKSINCKFTQEKTLQNKTLKSGGNFYFVKNEGIRFETLYPVKTTTDYTAAQNKKINSIIKAIANKNYAYIKKNFIIYFINEKDSWTLALKPKPKTQAYGQLQSVIITGKSVIHQININPTNGNNTKINFYCGQL